MSRLLDDPKKIKVLIRYFQSETRTTRTYGGNPYFIPPGISLDEHDQLAMESGMDPKEFERQNCYGRHHLNLTHTKLTLPPRAFPFQNTTQRTKAAQEQHDLQHHRLSSTIIHKINRNTKVSRNVKSLKYWFYQILQQLQSLRILILGAL